jgi:hypothetical protein
MKSLYEILPEKFKKDLTEAEKLLLQCAESGDIVDLSPGEEIDPIKYEEWGRERTIRSEIITFLLTDKKVRDFISYKGIEIRSVKIEGEFNLRYAEIPFPIIFKNCAFPDGVNLNTAKIKELNFSGCFIKNFTAKGLEVNNDLNFQNSTCIEGVDLSRARVGGYLICTNAKFKNKNKEALKAEYIKVQCDIHLDKFCATGEVNLMGAEIGGQLICSKSRLHNQNGDALAAQDINVQDIFLDEGFEAIGAIDLAGAKINGNLFCTGGKFKNKGGTALKVDYANIKHDVRLDSNEENKFCAIGEVDLSIAKVGGQLICTGGEFRNENGLALVAEGIYVQEDILLNDNFHAIGEVDLYSAKIGGNLNCTDGIFENENGTAIYIEDCHINGEFIAKWEKLSGKLILDKAKISKISIESDPKKWPQEISLNGFEYEKFSDEMDWRIFLEWIKRQDSFYSQPYTQLAKVLKNYGRDKEAIQVLIEREERKTKIGLESLIKIYKILRDIRKELKNVSKVLKIEVENKKFFNFSGFLSFLKTFIWWFLIRFLLWGKLTGYGYRPWRVFFILILFFISGWIIFYITPMVPLQGAISKNIAFYPPIYSIDTLIPFIDLYQENYWVPRETWAKVYLWIHIIAGWIFSSIFIVAITGIFKKE